jgi:hypothetical protein
VTGEQQRQATDGGWGIIVKKMFRALACAALGVAAAATPGQAAAGDRLAALLRSDDANHSAVRAEVEALGGSACSTLAGYAAERDERVRERAVNAMDTAGCARAEDYAPFFADRSAWVVRAVISATSRQRLVEAAPFYLKHLNDRRRLVSDNDSETLEDAAERALHRLTAQPIPYGPDAPLGQRDHAAQQWRDFFASQGREGQSAWLASGRAAIEAGLAGPPAARRAALDTLPLVGEPVRDLLTAALRRTPGDVQVDLVCTPDAPPRVGEEIPCSWSVRNVAAHRVTLALGPPGVFVAGAAASASLSEPAGPPPSSQKKASGGKPKQPPPPATPPVPAPIEPEALAGSLVDLAPGETVRRPIFVGPVATAGHYEVRVACEDLGVRLDPKAFPPGMPPLQAAIPMRFEQ